MTADRHPPPAPGTAICRLDDIADGGSRGFALGDGRFAFEFFLVRQGDRVYGYVNDCPHAHVPLEFQPDRFLNFDASAILCSTHGAQFRIEDGLCLLGPCVGRRLTPIAVVVRDGQVIAAATTRR